MLFSATFTIFSRFEELSNSNVYVSEERRKPETKLAEYLYKY